MSIPAPVTASQVFSLQQGYGKVLAMSFAESTDKVMVKYHPDRDAPPEALVPLVVDGNAVTLSADNPMVTIALPGTYQVVPVGTLSPQVRVSTTDGPGFPVALTVELKNVAG